MEDEIKISSVLLDETQEIHAISEEWVLSEKTNIEEGFLVSNFTQQDYMAAIENGETLLKAEKNNEIVGFLYGFESSQIKQNDIVGNLVRYILDDDFFTIKQVCIKKKSSNTKGVARRLYAEIIKSKKVLLAAAIVLSPTNRKSIKFHEQNGFEKWFEIAPPREPDGSTRIRGIWCFVPENCQTQPRLLWKKGDNEEDSLVDYHSTVANLYMHEDTLNWQKFGMNISFLMALLAALSYISKQEQTLNTTWISAALLIFLGFALNLIFSRKIASGLYYMNNHKTSLVEIESRLATRHGFPRILSGKNQRLKQQSETTGLLKKSPYLVNIIWIVASTLIFLKLFNY